MQDDEEDQGVPATELDLDAVEQVEVPFLDELLLALQGIDGDIYVPIVLFAQHLGMISPRNQVARIRRDETMSEALRRMPIETPGGLQHTQCLRIDMLTLWLATIRAAAVNENVRPALARYKREAARAILAYFTTKAQSRTMSQRETTAPPMPASGSSLQEWHGWYQAMADLYAAMEQQHGTLASHAARLDRHDDEITALSDDMQGVKEALAIIGEVPEPRISPHQASEIQQLVAKIHEHTGLHQKTIYSAFNKQWRIPRYDELPAAQCDPALEWLRQWGRARIPKETTRR